MLDDIEIQLSNCNTGIEQKPKIISVPDESSQNTLADTSQNGSEAESSEVIDENSLLQLVSLFANNFSITVNRVHIRLAHK